MKRRRYYEGRFAAQARESLAALEEERLRYCGAQAAASITKLEESSLNAFTATHDARSDGRVMPRSILRNFADAARQQTFVREVNGGLES